MGHCLVTWSVVELVSEVHHPGELVDEVDAVAAVVGHPSLVVHLLVDVGRLLKTTASA